MFRASLTCRDTERRGEPQRHHQSPVTISPTISVNFNWGLLLSNRTGRD
jgi:hypothetical protein